METAYLLFDGKYDMKFISSVPYKELMHLIETEQNLSDEYKEIKAAKSLKNQLG